MLIKIDYILNNLLLVFHMLGDVQVQLLEIVHIKKWCQIVAPHFFLASTVIK